MLTDDSLETSAPLNLTLPPYQGRAADRKALVDMQHVLYARTTDPNVPAHIQAQCARAWKDLQEAKRIIDGKPLPGQLRPDLQPKQSKAFGRPRSISVLKPAQPVLAKPAMPLEPKPAVPASSGGTEEQKHA